MSANRNSLEVDLSPLLNKGPRWSDGSRTRGSLDDGSEGDMRELPILKPLGHDDVWLGAPGEEDVGDDEDEDELDGMGRSPVLHIGSSDHAVNGYTLEDPSNSQATPITKWNLDSFLLSRSTTLTLPDLRSELRTYLSTLKSELGQLIEDDYEEFISLGLGLRGESERLLGLRDLLNGMNMNGQSGKEVGLKDEVHDIHTSLLTTQSTLSTLLTQRSTLREEKATVVMLLHLHESLSRVEGLLGVVGAGSGGKDETQGGESHELDEEEGEYGYSDDDEENSDEEDHLPNFDGPNASRPTSILDPSLILTSSPTMATPRISFPPTSKLSPSAIPSSSADSAETVLGVSALGRISSEYRQLVYLVEKAGEAGCGVGGGGGDEGEGEIEQRITRIQITLQTQLSKLFATQIQTLFSRSSSSHTASSGAKTTTITAAAAAAATESKAMNEMYEVLKVYDLIGGWRVAERVFEEAVERELGKIIKIQALTIAPSPGIPDTPYTKTPSANPFSPALAPSTPLGLTMSASASSNGNVFESTLAKTNANAKDSRITLLDEVDRPLAGIYNRILRFIERDCAPVMDVGERVRERNARPVASQSSGAGAPSTKPVGEGESDLSGSTVMGNRAQEAGPKDGFEFLANVVWNQVGSKIIEELGSAVFAAGRVSSLHQNYTLTHRFVDELENLAPSIHAVQALRSHPVYEAFEKRWQLPVYFQLRWKEIVTDLDGSLNPKNAIGAERGKDGYSLPQTAAVFRALQSCWSSEVYIPELSYRFWRLSLQLLSRYRTWLERSVPALFEGSSRRSFQQNNSGRPSLNISRSTTPVGNASSAPSFPTGDPATDPQSAVAEDNTLRIATLISTDLRKITANVGAFWDSEIQRLLSVHLGNEDMVTMKHALDDSLTELTRLSRAPASHIINILTRKCTVNVKLIRSVASQLRATPASKSASQQPQPSHFVSTILKPLRDYFGGIGRELGKDVAMDWSQSVFVEVVASYESVLQGVRETEALLARHRKGKKTGFSLFGSSSAASTAGADEEEDRFKRQMLLDIQTLGSEAKALGIDLEGDVGVPGWKTLLEAAERPTAES